MRKFTQVFFTGLIFLLFSFMGMAQKSSPNAKPQLISPPKETSSPSLKKIDPNLLNSTGQEQKQPAPGDIVQANNSSKENSRKVRVDIKCIVSENLLKAITTAGGEIINSSVEANSITANIPVLVLEQIAASGDVKYIAKSATVPEEKNAQFINKKSTSQSSKSNSKQDF